MISRGNMRRQLQANGGIMNARQGYGLGSFVKEKLRKLIPNELADIAVKAAPFVAPFQPGIAAAMRGIGRFDQRGSVSDALKQAGGTYAFGKGARYLGGATGKTGGLDSYTMEGFKKGPVGNMFSGGEEQILSKPKSPGTLPTPTKNPGIIERTTDKLFSKVPFADKISQTVKEQLAVGGVTSAATYLYEKFIADYPEPVPGEDMTTYLEERKKRVGTQMRTNFDQYFKFNSEYSSLDDAGKDAFVARYNANQGGLMRAGYAMGTPLPNDPKDTEEFDKILKRIEELQDMGLDLMSATKQAREEAGYNQGGRVGYAIGSPEKQMEAGAPPIIYEGNMDPNQQAGLPSIPGPVQMAEDGPEYDMSERGGFQPLGAQEGKDDVKANLAKNEFVFTADAVRAAGGGSIQKGAQRMYDTMKKLESRVA